MSRCDPTDLLCSSRREELTLDEQRRLRASLEYSFEVRLMSQMLLELERESRLRPGDDLLLARINAHALDAFGARPTPCRRYVAKRRTVMLLVAAAVLLVAGLAGAWLGGARPPSPLTPAPASAPVPSAEEPRSNPKPKALAPVAPLESSDSSEPSAPGPSVSPARGRDSKQSRPTSAPGLFAQANSLRRQGRVREAAELYEILVEAYPSSREVAPARLALAKHLQQTSQPERALAQFRALATTGGALRAEALWGLSEVALALDRRSVSEQALADLLREFPDSPYAEVARTRAAP